jgi:hypothetical protein
MALCSPFQLADHLNLQLNVRFKNTKSHWTTKCLKHFCYRAEHRFDTSIGAGKTKLSPTVWAICRVHVSKKLGELLKGCCCIYLDFLPAEA